MNNLADRVQTIIQEMDGKEYGKQTRLAEIAGCARAVVNHWLSGVQEEIRYAHARDIAKKLGYQLDWVISGIGPKRDGTQDQELLALTEENPSIVIDAAHAEDAISLSAQGGNHLFLNYVTGDEMRLITTYREKGKYRQMLDMIIDFNGKQA
jgi:transcriptional regulator with XRE-family HTH domain